MLAAMVLMATMAMNGSTIDREEGSGVQSMLEEESPDVFLAKATLQQYLSRVVRKDWDGTKRLTHPKALAVISALKKRLGTESHNLAPWANRETQLKTFRFVGAKQVAPGIVAVQVGEDTYRTEEQGMSTDDAAVYYIFKAHGGYLVGEKKAGMSLEEVSAESIRAGYKDYVDAQAQAQARRESAIHNGKHR